MRFFPARSTRRRPQATSVSLTLDVLESRRVLSAGNTLSATLTGAGGATGSAHFETETEHGRTESSFEIQLFNAPVNSSFDVVVDGVTVGQVTTNSIGRGRLTFSNSAEHSHPGFPSNWPGVSAGSTVSISNLLSGTIGVGTGTHSGNDGEGNENHTEGGSGETIADDGNGNSAGAAGFQAESSSENSEVDSAIALTGAGSETGTARFSVDNEHGTLKREFHVSAWNLSPGTTYPVLVDGVQIGSITANNLGIGALHLSDRPEHGQAGIPASFPTVTSSSTVQVGTVLSGTINGNAAASQSQSANVDHQRYQMTTTGAMSGVVDYQQQLDTSGAAVETEFRVTVWNESPGSTIDVMVDGVTVGSITINTWGYGTLSFHSDHATNTFPANWPGVSNGSVVTAGSGLTATFDPTMQVATPGHHELESAYELDHRLGLHIENNLYENWGDEGEKWLKGSDPNWYYITNDGSLYEWDGTNHASGTLVQQLDPAVYDDPELLYDAQPVQAAATDSNLLRWTAANLDHDLGLTEAASDHENWGGEGERWFKDSAGDWYFITPSGQVFSWDGSNHASGTLVAELDSTYHSDLSLLTRAESTLTTEETAYAADQGLGLRSLNDDFLNWGGEHEKWVMDASGEWYFITPDGNLSKWDHSRFARGELVTHLSSAYYDDLSLLTSAQSVGTPEAEAVLDDFFAEYAGY